MNYCLLTSLLLISVSQGITIVYSEDAPLVTTKLGTILGTVREVDVFGQQMKTNRYFGIPYGEPPVGELRFKKPVPKKSLHSPFDATKHGKTCSQMLTLPMPENKNISVGEDCLTLNVYVPVGRHGSQGNLAVMVWIHGGAFVSGASQPYVSDTLSVHGNVIVVTINYRLSIWGFLSTGDEHAPGNYGLWDQHLALKWVHDNIDAFGGDPGRVTIFGESAGAASVVYQGLFEGNKGFFQRAIAQSGSISNAWASCKSPKEDAVIFGKLVGCDDTNSGYLIDCLRNKSPDIINATINDFSNGLMRSNMPFVPTIDGEFVKEPAIELLTGNSDVSSRDREFFSTLDFMSGNCAEEGVLMLSPLFGVEDPENFYPNRTYFEQKLLPFTMPLFLGTELPEVLIKILAHEYTDWNDPENTEKRRNQLVALYSDMYLGVSLIETIERHHSLAHGSKNTYMYMFDILPSMRAMPAPSWAKRATHADDLLYTFFEESDGIATYCPVKVAFKPTDWDRENAKYLMTMWSNFAKSG